MVLAEDAAQYFDIGQESPYMLLAFPITESRRIRATEEEQELWGIDLLKVPRSDVPAITHVDYSARVQTIDRVRNPFMHQVISAFKTLTGCSVIINTSFNVRGEPIVCTAQDAFRCFMATEIDALVVGNRLLLREEQQASALDESQRGQWLARFELD
jgi:carbamoyltransferase